MKIPRNKFQVPIWKGFTLIELVIVFSVIAIISSGGILAFVNYSRSQILQQAVSDMSSVFTSARSKAQSQLAPSKCNSSLTGYDIKFEKNVDDPNNPYIMYTLEAQCGGAVAVDSKIIPKGIQFAEAGKDPSLARYPTYTFQLITGNVSVSPSDFSGIALNNTYNGAAKQVVISSVGMVGGPTPTLTPTPTLPAGCTPSAGGYFCIPQAAPAGSAISVVWGNLPNPLYSDYYYVYTSSNANTGYYAYLNTPTCTNSSLPPAGIKNGNCSYTLPSLSRGASYFFQLISNGTVLKSGNMVIQ